MLSFIIMRFRFHIILIISLSIFLTDVTAQTKPIDFVFRAHLEECQITFDRPEGFSEYEGVHDYNIGGMDRYNALLYTLVNKDSSIVIGLSLMPAPRKEVVGEIERNYRTSFNLNYLKTAKFHADTLHHKLVYYSPAYIKQKFNADGVVEFYQDCLLPYNGRYTARKVVTGVKNNSAQFEIIYFYNSAAKKKIDKVIKQTAGIMKFRNDITDR